MAWQRNLPRKIPLIVWEAKIYYLTEYHCYGILVDNKLCQSAAKGFKMEEVKIKGYIVREDGVVFGRRGKELTWHENGRGYLITRLQWKDETWNTKALHTVVCEAFHGERPEGYEAGHKDGNAFNNHKDNLKWMTKTENRKQMYQDGRDVSGTKNANSKYTEPQIVRVCELLDIGFTVNELLVMCDVSRATISAIKHKRQWVNISKNYSF